MALRSGDLLGWRPSNPDGRRCARCNSDDPYDWRIGNGRCCKQCRCDGDGPLVAVILSNGVRSVRVSCSRCGYRGGTAIAHSKLPAGIDPARLPVWGDNRGDTKCERCGSADGVELHHWAPRHLFEDAHLWPVGDLCRKCHREWHATVTPNMAHRS